MKLIDCRIRNRRDISRALSEDLQPIEVHSAVQYSLEPSLVTGMYESIGSRERLETEIIKKGILESVKAVTTNYTSHELIINRPVVKAEIINLINYYLSESLTGRDMDGLVKIANIALVEVLFSDQFSMAIENTVRAEQDALTAEGKKDISIIYAEADEQEKKINADAKAYRVTVIGNATAIAIAAEADALNQQEELLDLRALNKWNGELPDFMSNVDDDDLPFIAIQDQN